MGKCYRYILDDGASLNSPVCNYNLYAAISLERECLCIRIRSEDLTVIKSQYSPHSNTYDTRTLKELQGECMIHTAHGWTPCPLLKNIPIKYWKSKLKLMGYQQDRYDFIKPKKATKSA